MCGNICIHIGKLLKYVVNWASVYIKYVMTHLHSDIPRGINTSLFEGAIAEGAMQVGLPSPTSGVIIR